MLKMAFKEQAMDRTQTFKSHAKFKKWAEDAENS
jgi:hypothetical protein